MRPSCTCTRRFHLLDLNSGYCLICNFCLLPADVWRNAKVWLGTVVLLARRLKAANPDALHPGKAWENPEGKVNFPLGIFPAFLGQKPSNFSYPQRGRRSMSAYPENVISPVAGPGRSPPWLGSGANSPSVIYSLDLKFILESKLVSNINSEGSHLFNSFLQSITIPRSPYCR